MVQELISKDLKIRINDIGAELSSVTNHQGLEYMWQANETVWARHAPVLFPIVGKLKNNVYFFRDKPYQLTQHGFARDLKFEVNNSSNEQCSFNLRANEKTKELFPFDFDLTIEYRLHDAVLEVIYHIYNPSNSHELFFSIGAHPAFNIPLYKHEAFEDYSLYFKKNQLQISPLKEGLLDSTTYQLALEQQQLSLTSSLFDDDALIFENGQIEEISIISSKNAHKITLNCKNWPFFGIWSKKGCKEFVCLEPWYGIADTHHTNQQFTQKKGIIRLEPQKSFNCAYTIAFE